MKKWKKITYWVTTLWLCSGMLATGVQQLMKVQLEGVHSPPGVYGITALGYPVYLLTLLGIWKMLGVIALLIPKFPLVKEWAYAGIFFLLTGALFSHIAVGNPAKELFPSSLLLVLTILSWYFRPAERKVSGV
jgi:uncharacterized membrane protein YphA (DoxX/SURF4 family)